MKIIRNWKLQEFNAANLQLRTFEIGVDNVTKVNEINEAIVKKPRQIEQSLREQEYAKEMKRISEYLQKYLSNAKQTVYVNLVVK